MHECINMIESICAIKVPGNQIFKFLPEIFLSFRRQKELLCRSGAGVCLFHSLCVSHWPSAVLYKWPKILPHKTERFRGLVQMYKLHWSVLTDLLHWLVQKVTDIHLLMHDFYLKCTFIYNTLQCV